MSAAQEGLALAWVLPRRRLSCVGQDKKLAGQVPEFWVPEQRGGPICCLTLLRKGRSSCLVSHRIGAREGLGMLTSSQLQVPVCRKGADATGGGVCVARQIQGLESRAGG